MQSTAIFKCPEKENLPVATLNGWTCWLTGPCQPARRHATAQGALSSIKWTLLSLLTFVVRMFDLGKRPF